MRTAIQAIARSVISVIIVPVTFIGGVLNPKITQAATYYVATTGNDSNPGTLSQPFRTIQKAADLVRAGDTVLVRNGRYPAFSVVSKNGTASAPITFASYPNEQATVDCFLGGPSSHVRVDLMDVSYLIFDRLDVTTTDPLLDQLKSLDLDNSRDVATLRVYAGNQVFQQNPGSCGYALNSPYPPAQPVHHITFKDLKVYHTPYGGIGGRGDDIQITNSQFYDYGPYSGYGCYCTGRRWAITGNTYHNNIYALHLYDEYGTAPLRDSIIERNLMYDNGGKYMHTTSGVGWGQALIIQPGDNNIVRNNIIYNTKSGNAMRIVSTNTKVYNNLVYNNRRALGDAPDPVIGIKLDASGGIVKNNIVYQNDINIANNAGAAMSNNLTADPKFIDAAAGNFRLQSTSPAIGAGVPLSDVADDFDGTRRPQGSNYDIGPYAYIGTESVSAPSAPRNLTIKDK